MNYYKVSKSELENWIAHLLYGEKPSITVLGVIGRKVKDFLKSKKPVQVLDRKERAREIYKKIEKYIECVDGEKLIKGRQYIIFTDRESVPISKLSLELAELILPQKEYLNNPVIYCDLECDFVLTRTCKFDGEIELKNGVCQSREVNEEPLIPQQKPTEYVPCYSKDGELINEEPTDKIDWDKVSKNLDKFNDVIFELYKIYRGDKNE